MAVTNNPLGCVDNYPLDAQQTIKKAYDKDKLGHRSVEVHEDYNKVEYTYTSDGQISTVEYLYDSLAEVSTVTFTADNCSSLNGTIFNLTPYQDTLKTYKIIYDVACAATIPADTLAVKYIEVDIQACDVAQVVALATKLAIQADSELNALVTVTNTSDTQLQITNVTKGDTCSNDITDVSTGFTFAVTTQGTTDSVETFTYTYNSDKQLESIKNTSGQNVFDVVDPTNNVVTLFGKTGGGVDTRDNALLTAFSGKEVGLLEQIHLELRKLNKHFELINDVEVKEYDL
jgi:hypothetical protein